MGETKRFDALASVRRLIRVGNDKAYWRKREAEILAQRDHLAPDPQS